MSAGRIVVIGASSGGLEALRVIARQLRAGFPAPIAIVLHIAPDSPGLLGPIFAAVGPLPASNAVDGMRLQPGHIIIAPPDQHLLIEPGLVRTSRGPKENRSRPAIDPLFRSAAQVYGPGAIGVILTGSLDDGAAGLWAIKRLGGTAIVQDPADALFPSMPTSAARLVDVDYLLPLSDIPMVLQRLVAAPIEGPRVVDIPRTLEVEVEMAKSSHPHQPGLIDVAEPSPFACPECHGVLLRLKWAHRLRFRCHTGHAYSADSLMAAVREGIEESLWSAVRAVEEAALLMECLAGDLAERGHGEQSEALAAEAARTRRSSDRVRRLIVWPEGSPLRSASATAAASFANGGVTADG
jgi:two-component system chemotaxis response regulator CheB